VEPLNVWDYERLASERLDPGAYGYFAGGANDEVTLRDNVDAFTRRRLRPRVLVDLAAASTETTVLGQALSMPLLVAPMAYLRSAHPDGELGLARAAAAAGTIMCLSTFATSTLEDVAATGVPLWYQLYVPLDDGLARELVERVSAAGCRALVITVDVPGASGRRERDLRSGWSLPPGLTVPTVDRGGLAPHEYVDLLSPSVTWRDLTSTALQR
jgi:4-hydroxymandelate oxidase